jgi:RNA polymerase sigma factor (sigma-70 family)
MTDSVMLRDDGVASDAALIAAVRTGDQDAAAELYHRHAGAAWVVARQYTHARADADDVVADSFAAVLGALGHGSGPDVAFRAYLFTVVRRVATARREAGLRVRPTDDLATLEAGTALEGTAEEPALAGFERGVVARAFQTLPERWQAVLWHTEVEGLTAAEVAPLLGLTANGVAALSYRAREGLRQAYLQQHLADKTAEGCRSVAGKLGSHVRGGLSSRDARKVEQHLDGCGDCRALVLELRDVNHGMRSVVAPLVLGLVGVGALAHVLPIGGGIAAGLAAVAGDVAPGAATAGAAGAGAGAAAAGSGAGVGAGAAGAGAAGTGAGAAGTAGAGAAGAGAAGASAAAAGAAGVGAAGASVAGAAGAGAAGAGVAGAAGAGLAGATTAGAAAAGAAVSVGVGAGAAAAAGGTAAVGAAAVGAAAATGGVAASVAGIVASVPLGVAAVTAGGVALAAATVVGTIAVIGGPSAADAVPPAPSTSATASPTPGATTTTGAAPKAAAPTASPTDLPSFDSPTVNVPVNPYARADASGGQQAQASAAQPTEPATDPTAQPSTQSTSQPATQPTTAPTTPPTADPTQAAAAGPTADPTSGQGAATDPTHPAHPTHPAPPTHDPASDATAAAAPASVSVVVPSGGLQLAAGATGQTLSVAVANAGDAAANHLVAEVTLPAGFDVAGLSVATGAGGHGGRSALAGTDGWVCTSGENPSTARCDLAELPARSSEQLSLQVAVAESFAADGALRLHLRAAGVDLQTTPIPVTVRAAPARLALGTVPVSPAFVTGVPSTLHLELANVGGRSGDVSARIALPAGVRWTSAGPAAPWTCTPDGSAVDCVAAGVGPRTAVPLDLELVAGAPADVAGRALTVTVTPSGSAVAQTSVPFTVTAAAVTPGKSGGGHGHAAHSSASASQAHGAAHTDHGSPNVTS